MRGWRAWARPHGDSAVLNGSPMRLVEIREERAGRSAWLARLGAPRTAIPPCDPYMFFSLSPACAASSCRAQRTPNAFSRDKGGEGRKKCVAGALERASHGDFAVRSIYVFLSVTCLRGIIVPRSTEAHCIVATHYLLPSSPFSLLLTMLHWGPGNRERERPSPELIAVMCDLVGQT